MGGTEATSGFVMGSMAISALLCRPWFGRLADRRGARLVLMIGACLACVSVLVLAAFPILISFHVGLGIGPLLGEFVLGRSDYGSVWLAVGGLVLVRCAISSFLPRRIGVHGDQMAPTPLVLRAAIAPGFVTLFGVFAFRLVFGVWSADTGDMATAAAPIDRGESRLRFVPTPAQARVIAELLEVAPPAKRRATEPRS